MSLVLDRGGTPLDHIAIGVPDTVRGCAEIAELTGFEPFIHTPNPETFYWSGALPMGQGKFLEILGPNPEFRGFNPFIEMVKRLDRPTPLFWYVATDDFAAFCELAKEAGGPVERITEHAVENEWVRMDFIRGHIGPGFLSVCPNVIQWRERDGSRDNDPGPTFLELNLSHPEADRLNSVFAKIGIDQEVRTGPHQMELVIDTPKGEVRFAAEGIELRGLAMLPRFIEMYVRWLIAGRR